MEPVHVGMGMGMMVVVLMGFLTLCLCLLFEVLAGDGVSARCSVERVCR